MTVVTEHEIATERGPCRVLKGKQADGLVIADGGACIWLECEHSQKSRPERHKTVALVQECIGGPSQVELAPGLWLARVAIVATNTQALRWMAASFQDAHRRGQVTESQVCEVEACLLPVSESLVPGDLVEGNSGGTCSCRRRSRLADGERPGLKRRCAPEYQLSRVHARTWRTTKDKNEVEGRRHQARRPAPRPR
jgi:hypothetical protein